MYFFDVRPSESSTLEWVAKSTLKEVGTRRLAGSAGLLDCEGLTRMGRTYLHPAMKQLKDQQTRYAPRERRLEQVERAEQLLGEIEGAKRYPYEYLCYRITGFRPDGWPALVLEGGDVQHDLRMFVEDLVGDGTSGRRAGRRAGLDGRRSESALQRVVAHGDTLAPAGLGGAPVRDRRSHQGRFSRVEPAAICYGPSRAGRTGVTVSATDRGGARRDHSSRPPHGARSPRAGRPGRDRAEDRT